jgi:hypothetical protein
MREQSLSQVNADGFLQQFWQAAQGDAALLSKVQWCGRGSRPAACAVSDLAVAALAAAGLAQRLRGPVSIECGAAGCVQMAWQHAAAPLGSASPQWW